MSGGAHEVRVRLAGFRKYKGFSDLVETYCCSATSCYYVEFPALDYGGYFQKADVEVRRWKNGKANQRALG
jgi:hypothetical protein